MGSLGRPNFAAVLSSSEVLVLCWSRLCDPGPWQHWQRARQLRFLARAATVPRERSAAAWAPAPGLRVRR